MADIYQSQTNPGGSTALSGANAEAFGGGIGRALQESAAEIGRIEQRKEADKQRREAAEEKAKGKRRDAENAEAGLIYATTANELSEAEIAGRDTAGPGAAGHREAIAKLADQRKTEALAKITDPELRKVYEARYTTLTGNAVGNADIFERAAHTDLLVSNVAETTRVLAVSQANNPDPVALDDAIATIETTWDNLAVADAVKVKGKRAGQREVVLAYAQKMAEVDPDGFLGDDKTKRPGQLSVLSAYLEPSDVATLRNMGQAEAARLAATQAREAAVFQAKRRDEIGALLKRVDMGDYSVSDKDFDAAAADAKTFGDQTLLLDIANKRDQRDVVKLTRDWAPAEWAANIGALEAKGDKISPAEAIRLDHLRAARPAAEARFKSDPAGWAGNAGDPIPAIDWEHPTPAMGEARARWSQRIVAQGGDPTLLNPQELAAFQKRAGAGIAGQIEVAQEMRSIFGVSGARAALKQIDKGNPHLAIMAGLPANSAADYARGVEAIARNAKLNRKDLANDYFSTLGSAIPVELRGALFQAARSIAAAELDRAGEGDPDPKEYQDAFMRGVQRAAGATGSRGGVVRWKDAPIWLPPEMEKSEALRRLSRATPVALIEAQTGPGGNGSSGPPYLQGTNGKLYRLDRGQAGELLNRGDLQSVAPGVFQIVLEDGGHVVTKSGALWQFDIRKLK